MLRNVMASEVYETVLHVNKNTVADCPLKLIKHCNFGTHIGI